MEIHPPIKERTTENLLDIVETREQWRTDVVELAQQELTKRGITLKKQETRRTIKVKFKQRVEKIKGRATYTTLEKVLIILLGPILVFGLGDLFLFDSGEGYKKKNKQGFLYLLLGFGVWGLTIYFLV